ncbi:MAG: sigma-70 family RNA polymerase sigma factor [Anaerolineaceae bacterium]|nr:sigma-70 family RNA polymerase sigma factor [Anaerolineaceae bacterium]
MNFSETEILQKALQKDDGAFAELVEKYQSPVYNLCFRMLGSEVEAEDAAQETFWRAYQALNRYDPNRSFITWLLSIAAHLCIDQQRKRKVTIIEMDEYEVFDIADRTPQPEARLIHRQEEEIIARSLNQLSDLDRAAVILRYWQGFSEEEIASSLSLTVSAVKSRLHRARLQLAGLLKEEGKQLFVEVEKEHHGTPAF